MEVQFDGQKMLELIYELVNIPSPTGYCDQIISKIESYPY